MTAVYMYIYISLSVGSSTYLLVNVHVHEAGFELEVFCGVAAAAVATGL